MLEHLSHAIPYSRNEIYTKNVAVQTERKFDIIVNASIRSKLQILRNNINMAWILFDHYYLSQATTDSIIYSQECVICRNQRWFVYALCWLRCVFDYLDVALFVWRLNCSFGSYILRLYKYFYFLNDFELMDRAYPTLCCLVVNLLHKNVLFSFCTVLYNNRNIFFTKMVITAIIIDRQWGM